MSGAGNVAFEAVIEPLEWGRNPYTILRLTPEVMAALGGPKRVTGEVAEHPVDLGVARADPKVLADPFCYLSKAFLKAAGIGVGDAVEVRLAAADPDAVDVPTDVAAALRGAGLTAAWKGLTPGRRRGLLAPIAKAVRPDTRTRRIAVMMREVRNG